VRQPSFTTAGRAEIAPLPLRESPRGPTSDAGYELELITTEAALGAAARMALLAVFEETGTHLDLISTSGLVPDQDRVPLADTRLTFIGRVIKAGRPLCQPVALERDPWLAAADDGHRVTYAAGAPVDAPGEPKGALCVGLAGPPADVTRTLWLVDSYARMASLCLHDGRARAGLLAAARFDWLTGCLNYAGIAGELAREIGRSTRTHRPLACCFIDLDNFKQVNDRFGHERGNRVLAAVADGVRSAIRIGDSVGRYGGDEFVVLLPDADSDNADALAQRLQSMIQATNLTGRRWALDSSIGIAHWREGMLPEDLLGTADEALRSAKQAGGHAIVTASHVATRADRDV
jgi:diguanylate cyclase (GGDEF)-like protein